MLYLIAYIRINIFNIFLLIFISVYNEKNGLNTDAVILLRLREFYLSCDIYSRSRATTFI